MFYSGGRQMSLKSLDISKKTKIGALIIALNVSPIAMTNAYAVPVTDITSIAQIIQQTAQQASNFATEMATYAKQMANDIQLQAQQMRSDFNRTTMEVGSITDTLTDLENLKSLATLQPIKKDACQLITTTEHAQEMENTSKGLTGEAMDNLTRKSIPDIGEVPNDTEGTSSIYQTPREYRLNMYDRLMSSKTLPTTNTTGSTDETSAKFLNPSYLFQDNLSSADYFLANIQKDLLAGPPENEFNYVNPESTGYKEEYVTKARNRILKNYAVYAIQETIDNRYAADSNSQNVSKIGAIEEYLDKTVRDKEWVMRYTNTDPDVQNLTTSAQVMRMLLGIEAKRLEVEMMNYKQQEQIKSMAAINALIDAQ